MCCSICRKQCNCDGKAYAAEELPYKGLQTANQNVPLSLSSQPERILDETDRQDLRLSLQELKDQYSCGMMSMFHDETSHGFSDELINDLIEHSSNIFFCKIPHR